MNPALERLQTLTDDLRTNLQAADAPAEIMHIVGLLNGMLKVYERTDAAGIDPFTPSEPLVALPAQVKYLEEQLNKMFERVGTTKVRFSTE